MYDCFHIIASFAVSSCGERAPNTGLMGQGAIVDNDSAIKNCVTTQIYSTSDHDSRSEPIKLVFSSDQFSDEHVRREVYPLKRRVLFVWIPTSGGRHPWRAFAS